MSENPSPTTTESSSFIFSSLSTTTTTTTSTSPKIEPLHIEGGRTVHNNSRHLGLSKLLLSAAGGVRATTNRSSERNETVTNKHPSPRSFVSESRRRIQPTERVEGNNQKSESRKMNQVPPVTLDDRMPLLVQQSRGGGPNARGRGTGGGLTQAATTATSTTALPIGGSLRTVVSGLDSDEGEGDMDDEDGNEQTTVQQTFIHLLKGYIGPGMLSLPWAVSQLGIPVGCIGIFIMAFWSTYNSWVVVRLRRFIEQQHNARSEIRMNANFTANTTGNTAGPGSMNNPTTTTMNNNNTADGGGDLDSEAASSVTTRTNMTYPDVGEWAYGKTFQAYVSGCICTQQLAVCTVFISFVGENLLVVLRHMHNYIHLGNFLESHVGVMTLALPFFMSLSFIPSLKGLVNVMMAATILMLLTLLLLGVFVGKVWHERPTTPEEGAATINPPMLPLALCAILYSFEGICLVLPIESAMKETKHFKSVFFTSMTVVACIMAVFSAVCVTAYGTVTNGSITAFLVEKYHDNESLQLLLLLTNFVVSLSVLLTYPLQMYPAVELMAQSWSPWFDKLNKTLTCCSGAGNANAEDEEEGGEKDLTGFDPLPPLPEHGAVIVSQWDWDELEEHRYEDEPNDTTATAADSGNGGGGGSSKKDADLDQPLQPGALALDSLGNSSSNNNNSNTNTTVNTTATDADAVSLRSLISSALSFPNQMMPKMVLPGDSIQLRAVLVLLTFVVAVVVPNVQALISLAGALAGASTALLIPPIMKLAYIRYMEEGTTNNNNRSNITGTAATSAASNALEVGGGGVGMGEVSNLVSPSIAAESDANPPSLPLFFKCSKWWLEKVECYVLFALGVVFMVIGTNASLADIAAIYLGKKR